MAGLGQAHDKPNKGYLNPLLKAMNEFAAGGDAAARQRVACQQYRQQRMHGVPAAPQIDESSALQSTIWGWGTKHCTVPLPALQAHLQEHAMATFKGASGDDISAFLVVTGDRVSVGSFGYPGQVVSGLGGGGEGH